MYERQLMDLYMCANRNVFVCSHILDTPVTEREFLEQLHELNHKINFVKEQSFRDARACHDVKDILEKLKIKVCAKIELHTELLTTCVQE